MNDITTLHSFRCELNAGPCEAELRKALMHQDALADTFRVAVCRNMAPVDLADMTVTGYLYCPATRQTILLDGAAEGHFASVTLTDGCYAQPGWYSLVIQLQQGDVRHTVLKVDFAIQRTGSETLIVPGESTTLAELIERIEALEEGGGTGSGGTGTDGFSPVASVQQTDEGAVVTITDKTGTTTATVSNGKTPVKGTDYWTAEDQEAMVQAVIAALPDASEVSY